ncbi:MAG: SPOR domain-containing protein [Lysobacteraceae bacterium]
MAARRGKKQARRSGGAAATPGWVWMLAGMMISAVVAVGIWFKISQPDDGLPKPNPSARATTATDSAVAPEGNGPGASSKPPAQAVDSDVDAAAKQKYTFYNILPEKEVIIPDSELSARVKAEAAADAASKVQAQALANAANTTSATTVTRPIAATTTDAGNASTASVTPPASSSTADWSASTDSAATTPAASGRYLLQAGAFRGSAQADDLKARIALLGLVGRVEIVQTANGPMHRVRLGPYATASELESAKQKLGQGGMPAVAIRVK